MKVISGMNFLTGLEVMRIWEKNGGSGQDFDRNRNYLFFFLVRSSKAELWVKRQVGRIASMKHFRSLAYIYF